MKLFSLRKRMDALEAISHRISANQFDSAKPLTRAEIDELVQYATQAPSSFNLQHWRFAAVTEHPDKVRLMAVAYHQRKVVDAAVTFIVLGDLEAHTKAADILSQSVTEGIFDQATAEEMIKMARVMYADPVVRRDEAIRSASLAAMTLMLAAEAKGLVSGPMVEFDPQALRQEFRIPERYLPVMLIAVGHGAPGNWPRKPRLSLEDVLVHGVVWNLP
jgi:nitroreductase